MLSNICIAAVNHVIRSVEYHNMHSHFMDRVSLTTKRIQKIIYFADVHYMLNHNGTSFIPDDYCAWPSGSVIPSIYYVFMIRQSNELSTVRDYYDHLLEPEMKASLNYILDLTANMDTLDLIDAAKAAGEPWHTYYNANDADHNDIVPKDDIYHYYLNHQSF